MLSDPSLLLLDEPTSGLDSSSAHHLMISLQKMARAGRTVIASVHQPRSDVWHLIDNIILLSRGHIVYIGSTKELPQYFASLGHVCPPLTNPADWILDLSSVDLRNLESENASRARLKTLVESFSQHSHNQFQKGAHSPLANSTTLVRVAATSTPVCQKLQEMWIEKSRSSFWNAFPVLLSRSYLNFARSPLIIIARIFQVVSYAIILSLFFARMKYDYYYVQNRIGLLQEFTALLFVGMLNCFAVFPAERNVFYRERADEAYSTFPFFLSYLLGEVPFELISSILFAIFVGPICNMRHGAQEFFATVFTAFFVLNAGESIGILFCALIYHAGFAVSLVNSVLTIFTVTCGFMSISMPKVIDVINYISVLRYAARINADFEFTNLEFSCLTNQLLPNGVCPVTNGNQVLAQLNFDTSERSLNFGILVFLSFMYRLIAYLALKLNTRNFAQ